MIRIQNEIKHNKKKFEKLRKEEEKLAEERARIRAPDEANVDQLIGGGGERPRAGDFRNEEGVLVPVAMRNYQERNVLGGFIKLRRYERIDLFWGRIKDVERDFIFAHLYIFMMMTLILLYTLYASSGEQKFYGNI